MGRRLRSGQGSVFRSYARDDERASAALVRMAAGAGCQPPVRNQRAPRDPNYWVEGTRRFWVGWEPRVIKGVREGRWASDGIEGGGLLLPDGLKYWPLMGTGELKYSYQSIAFAAQGNVQTYEYTYDPKTYRFLSYRPAAMAWVKGQEVGPDGTVYLAQRWLRGNYIAITVWR